MSDQAFTPGERVIGVDGRTGAVKSIDWGGVYVDLDPTETEGREVRLYRPLDLKPMEVR